MHLISACQKKFTVLVLEKELNYILAKYAVISLNEEDFRECSHRIHNNSPIDIEDDMIYGLARKAKCLFILTFNVKDFVSYNFRTKIITPRNFKNRFSYTRQPRIK
jgi:predicted nucleic acid-binding protein